MALLQQSVRADLRRARDNSVPNTTDPPKNRQALRDILHFEPSARLQSILSRELVADPNVAVLEFVKNSYDAGAREVVIDFELGDHRTEGRLTIADDGEGMDLSEFKQNWMRPGFSEKADDEYQPRRGRIPSGEKGLGRLAAGRLGEVLDVYTRKSRGQPWLHARFKWSDFDDMNRSLVDINIPIDDELEPDLTVGDAGTVVQISALRLSWDAKVPGRKSPGRHPTRIGRLRQDLEMLLLPLAASGEPFKVWLDHNSTQPEDEPPGPVEAPFLDLIHYRYDFDIRRRRSRWEVKRTIRRGAELLEEAIAQEQGLVSREVSTERLAAADGTDPSNVGPFTGSFFYAPDSADRLRRVRAPIGVLLYRDGVRVEPYGQPGNDWLGAQAKKASRQGYAAIQPAALYGAVRISRAENPGLRSQANREGLIENDEYETFIQICRAEFSTFERLVFDEYLSKKWKSPAEQRRDSALATQGYAVPLARTLMHSVNQPVATANATLDRLQTFIDRRIDDASVKSELQALHDRTAAQLSLIGDAIRRVLEVVDFDPTPRPHDLADVIHDVVNRRIAAQTEPEVEITMELNGALRVNLPPAPVQEALMELLSNAAEASSSGTDQPKVTVSAKEHEGAIEIAVADNGGGIPASVEDHLFKRAASTTGSIGMGLILIRQLLHLINGNVAVQSSGPEGTRFTITVPTELE